MSSPLSVPLPITAAADGGGTLVRSAAEAKQRLQVALAVIGFWLAFYLMDLQGSIIEGLQSTEPFDWQFQLFGSLYYAVAWCAVSPGILWLCRRFSIEGAQRWRHLGLHVGAGWLIGGSIAFLIHTTMPLILGHENRGHHWSTIAVVLANAGWMTFIYMTFVSATHAARYLVRSEERERLLMQAQVQALKAQLNPHFLYNTLNAVSDYAYKDAETAERLVTMLCDLLRLSFSGSNVDKVSLADELSFVRRYLDIQQLLLGDRLQVQYAIDPATLDKPLPNFLLQPLVENAVVHGISRRAAAGQIEVGSRVEAGKLQLWVRDNGPGSTVPATRRHGIGLTNTQARLQQLYGDAQRLELDSPATGGFCAHIELPCEAPLS
jgi:hypothetical protein